MQSQPVMGVHFCHCFPGWVRCSQGAERMTPTLAASWVLGYPQSNTSRSRASYKAVL